MPGTQVDNETAKNPFRLQDMDHWKITRWHTPYGQCNILPAFIETAPQKYGSLNSPVLHDLEADPGRSYCSLIFDHCNIVPLMIVKSKTSSPRLLCYDLSIRLELDVGWAKAEGLEKQVGASERPISHAANFPSFCFVYQFLHRHTIIATYRVLPRGESANRT